MIGADIRIGSRGSPLALVQARLVAEAFAQAGRPTRIVVVETEGDRRAPDTAWGEGAFVAAIERGLLSGRVDVAVHSAKDIPTEQDPRLRIAAYLPRADPRDALVVAIGASARRLADLPAGSRIGTDSPRRTGFLLARRQDLSVHPLHGNVDTRLRRLDADETDALVLACAGLDRLGLGDRIAERLDPEIVPPAPGQAAIAIQTRADDALMLALAATIDDRPTRQAVETERAFLKASGGGCRAPIGALASVVGEEIDLLVGWASPDGARVAFARRRGSLASAEELGRGLATELDPLARSKATGRPLDPAKDRLIAPRVLVTRAPDQAGEFMSALRAVGLEPVPVPTIAVELKPGGGELDSAARHLWSYEWVILTSANGARALLRAAERVLTPFEATRFAAIGLATRRVLEREGVDVDFVPGRSTAAALAAELPVDLGKRVLVVRGDLAADGLAVALRARGAEVDDVIAYRTREAPERSRDLLRAAVLDGPIAAVVFTSGSTVDGLLSLGQLEAIDVRSFPAICIGPETVEVARASGFRILAVPPTPDAGALASAAAEALSRQPLVNA